jgi:hypothetical protein
MSAPRKMVPPRKTCLKIEYRDFYSKFEMNAHIKLQTVNDLYLAISVTIPYEM